VGAYRDEPSQAARAEQLAELVDRFLAELPSSIPFVPGECEAAQAKYFRGEPLTGREQQAIEALKSFGRALTGPPSSKP